MLNVTITHGSYVVDVTNVGIKLGCWTLLLKACDVECHHYPRVLRRGCHKCRNQAGMLNSPTEGWGCRMSPYRRNLSTSAAARQQITDWRAWNTAPEGKRTLAVKQEIKERCVNDCTLSPTTRATPALWIERDPASAGRASNIIRTEQLVTSVTPPA